MFVDECHVTRLNQGLFSTTMEEEKRDPGNEVANDAPRDLGPEVGFEAKFQIPVAKQGGREMSAPRPYVTEPFRPVIWINNWSQFLYTPISKNVVAENGQLMTVLERKLHDRKEV